jgi:hypothetical protein
MEVLKKCSKCKELKTLENFHKNSRLSHGVAGTCKTCKSAICRLYYIKHSDSCKEKSLHYFHSNKEKRNNWEKNKLQNDVLFKLKKTLSHRVRRALHRINEEKISTNITHDIGCSMVRLKMHLQLQFHRNPRGKHEYMTWDNHGVYGWHIDHIKPLSLAKSEQEMIELCHYTNLRPMWSIDNIKKSDKAV